MPFNGLLSLASVTLGNNFLNMCQGIMLPSLPVSILYGTVSLLLPAHVANSEVHIDQFLYICTESILTVSISPLLSVGTSLAPFCLFLYFFCCSIPSWNAPSCHTPHTHILPYTEHCLSWCNPPQYLHGCHCDVQPTGALVVSSFAFFDTFILLNCLDSVSIFKTAACALCASTLFAQAQCTSTSYMVTIIGHCQLFYNFFQHVFVVETTDELLLVLSIYLLVIALYCCYTQPSQPLFHIFIIIAVYFSELEQLDHFIILGFKFIGECFNRPSSVLHVSFSAVVSVSKYCNPFLPNQFLTSTNLSVCGVLYVDRILLTSNLNVFNSLYLSCAFQSNVSWFMAGLPTLGPDPSCILSAWASTIVCIAILVASATAIMTASLMICSDAMTNFLVWFSVTYLPNYYFFTPDTMWWYHALLWWWCLMCF